MGQRVVIGLTPNANWGEVKQRLVQAGAETVSDPAASQSDVLVVTLPSDANVASFLEQAKRLPGVRYAEADAWRFSS